QADPQTMAPLTEDYRYHVVPSSYGGVAQRWVLIYSEPRQPQAQRTVDKQWLKQSDREVKAFQTLCRTAFACEADAQQALAHFAHDLQATFLHDSTICPTPRYRKRGASRPWRTAGPDRLPYRRSPGVSDRGPSGACRPAQLFHPRDERTRRGPVARARGTGRIQRAGVCRARLPLPQRSPVFGLGTLSQKT